jgi:hypothetical protein
MAERARAYIGKIAHALPMLASRLEEIVFDQKK